MQDAIQSPKIIIINAVVTFFQASLGALVITDGIDKAAIAGAAGIGLSVVWNTVLKPYLKTQGILYNKV